MRHIWQPTLHISNSQSSRRGDHSFVTHDTVCTAALAALQHIAGAAPADSLRGYRELLADTSDERVWPASAPAAVALMTAAEGALYCSSGWQTALKRR